VTGTQWEHQPEVRDALRTIVCDPQLGVPTLSSPQALSNLLKDLLPDAPRETSVLVAAAEAGLPQTLADHVAQGMDLATASSVTESAFAARTPFTREACSWAVGELAVALGLAPGAPAGVAAPARPASPPPASPGQPVTQGQPASPGQRAGAWPQDWPSPPGQQQTLPPAGRPPRADTAETQLPGRPGPAPPGWYGPPPPGGPPPAGVRKAPHIPVWVYLAGGLVALLVIVVIGLAAAAHRGGGQVAAERLSQIIKPDVKRCRAASPLSMPGVTSSLACSTSDVSIGLSAYQFDSAADYRAGLAHLNGVTGWNVSLAGRSCPPPAGSSIGREAWHTLLNPAYRTLRPGQILECYTDPQVNGLFLYLWTLPGQRVILVAGDSVAGASYTDLQDWWEKLTYG
jgi:hypothetical protein